MALNIDAALGVHDDALLYRARRTEVLANNLANADTPQFKARDLEGFGDVLARVQGQGEASALPLSQSDPRHLGPPAGGPAHAEASLLYRQPMHPSLDGNTVDIHQEKAAFAEHTLQYQASVSFLGSKLKGLVNALKGE